MKREHNFRQAGLSAPMKTSHPASSAVGLRVEVQWGGEPLAVAIPVKHIKPCVVCNETGWVNAQDKACPAITVSQQCPSGCWEHKHGRWQDRVRLVVEPLGQSMVEPWHDLNGRTVERNGWEQ